MSLGPLLWDDGLGSAAHKYLESISSSRALPEQIFNDELSSHFVDMNMEYDSHVRGVILPMRFEWSSPLELVFDLLIDDDHAHHEVRRALLSKKMTHIGIACNCHSRLNQVCVFEIAENPRPKLASNLVNDPFTCAPYEEPEIVIDPIDPFSFECVRRCQENPPSGKKYNECCECLCERPEIEGNV